MKCVSCRGVAIISKVGGTERLVLYLFFSVNPCLIDRFYHTFLLNMLYGCIIIYDYKTEGKKERKKKR